MISLCKIHLPVLLNIRCFGFCKLFFVCFSCGETLLLLISNEIERTCLVT